MAETAAPRRVDYDLTHKAAHDWALTWSFRYSSSSRNTRRTRRAAAGGVFSYTSNMVNYAIEIRELDNNSARLEGIPTVAERR